MPEYTVKIVHTLRIVGTVQVAADTSEEAAEVVEQRAAEGKLGQVQWRVEHDQSGVDGWYEEEGKLEVEDGEEGAQRRNTCPSQESAGRETARPHRAPFNGH